MNNAKILPKSLSSTNISEYCLSVRLKLHKVNHIQQNKLLLVNKATL